MKRKYPERPIVGVGGIVLHEDRVVLVKRGREPSLGEWSIPGGAVHVGETLKEAVVREVLEETHLEVEVVALIEVLERIFREPDGRVAYHYVLADFLCRPKSGELAAGSDAREAQYVALADIPAFPLVAKTRRVIEQAARRLKAGEAQETKVWEDIYE